MSGTAPAISAVTAQSNHFDRQGQAHMVDVGAKAVAPRLAVAQGSISMHRGTRQVIESGSVKKGDVLGVARLAAIMASKRTADLIPLCHQVALSHVTVDFQFAPDAVAQHNATLHCSVLVQCQDKTGVEMEALTAVSIALLTVYDMCKFMDRGMVMHNIRLTQKRGGKSGTWQNPQGAV